MGRKQHPSRFIDGRIWSASDGRQAARQAGRQVQRTGTRPGQIRQQIEKLNHKRPRCNKPMLAASQFDPWTAVIRNAVAGRPMKTRRRRVLSRTATGVRLRRSGNNSWPSGANHRQPESSPSCRLRQPATRPHTRAHTATHPAWKHVRAPVEWCRHCPLALLGLAAPRVYILALLCLGSGRAVDL